MYCNVEVEYCRRQNAPNPVNHCRIRTKQEDGKTVFYLIEQKMFDSLYNLITYYRAHALRSQNFSQILTEPIPQPDAHKNKPYVTAGLLACVSYFLALCMNISKTVQDTSKVTIND